jgi:hypothetical protein
VLTHGGREFGLGSQGIQMPLCFKGLLLESNDSNFHFLTHLHSFIRPGYNKLSWSESTVQ